MTATLTLAGYQGARSVHTRALLTLAEHLGPGVVLDCDVTADGRTAGSLFAAAEHRPGLICYMASSYLTARVPELAVLDLPFSVTDRADAHARLDGPAGAALRQAVAARTGYRVLGLWDNGFRHISNAVRPIRAPADCAGLRIRTLDNAIYQEALHSFGFIPVVTDVRDLVHAVRTRLVDAQENPLTNLLTFGLDAHHPNVSLTGHLFGTAILLCSAAWFATLPDPVAIGLQTAAAAATSAQRRFAADDDAAALLALAQRGHDVILATGLDLDGFRRACTPVRSRVLAALDPALVAAWLGPGPPTAG